jgi:pilus assembly protein Flp/PilA
MQRFTKILRRFLECDDGVTAIEYALLGGLIAVVIVVAVSSVGTGTNALFAYVAGQMAAAATSAGL